MRADVGEVGNNALLAAARSCSCRCWVPATSRRSSVINLPQQRRLPDDGILCRKEAWSSALRCTEREPSAIDAALLLSFALTFSRFFVLQAARHPLATPRLWDLLPRAFFAARGT